MGFSLLEVMCAFAILAVMTGQLTTNFVDNVQKATTALSHRELREAADTIFRKMIYEWQEYKDGDERTLDEEYGKFADLKGIQRDRWAMYRFRLEKRPRTVVGTPPEGEEALFGEDAEREDTTPATAPTGGSPGTDGAEGAQGESAGLELVEMTLRIYYTEEATEEPLLILRTWLDPERGQVTR
jgi:type II secretory pathway pseudopilin PulG